MKGVNILIKEEFRLVRKKLGKTQKQLSGLLGISLKTIHSYEQGWRTIPPHIERQIYFLLIHQRGNTTCLQPCWEQKTCNIKESCPAWEFNLGELCWFLCGTLNSSANVPGQKNKLEKCKECEILAPLLK